MATESFEQILARIKKGTDQEIVSRLAEQFQYGNAKFTQLKPGGELITWRMGEDGKFESVTNEDWVKNLRIIREGSQNYRRGRGRGNNFNRNRNYPY